MSGGGASATPGAQLHGHVAYIESRSEGHVTLVPRDVVQAVGNRNVVYVLVEGGEGRFAERTVKLGAASGESLEVLEGVKPGELGVTAREFLFASRGGADARVDKPLDLAPWGRV